MSRDELQPYLSGAKLWGDDFSRTEIEEWHSDEREAYANLGAKERSGYRYGYHQLNRLLGFRGLPNRRWPAVLGIGSAYGDEFIPILDRMDSLTIVEPSLSLRQESLGGLTPRYVAPGADGRLPLDDRTFDLVTVFDVLHHIPNVSFVASEIARCVRIGGRILVREPVVSMGDWRNPRRGLTKRERGIPLPILRQLITSLGMKVHEEHLFGFPLTGRICHVLGLHRPFNNALAVVADLALSYAFSWNLTYHPQSSIRRLRPTSVFMNLERIA